MDHMLDSSRHSSADASAIAQTALSYPQQFPATFVDALLWGGPYPEQHFVSVKNDLQVTRYQLQNLQNYQLLDGTM